VQGAINEPAEPITSGAKLWRLMFSYMMIIGSLMLSGRNLPALMYLSCHFGLPKAHFVFVFLFFL
jgi:hypothetical protein